MLPRLACLIAVLLVAPVLGGSLGAQSFDLAAHGQQIIVLDQLMRFHLGNKWLKPQSFYSDNGRPEESA